MKITTSPELKLLIGAAAFVLVLVLAFWTSPNGQNVGAFSGLVGKIYVDKTSNMNLAQSDLMTVAFLFHSNNGIGRLGQDIIVRRILVTDGKIGGGCGSMKVKLYTFFNIKLFDTGYSKGCP